MCEKSHVSLERHVCVVCGVAYDTGDILLDRRLRATLGYYTTTGWGLCTEHQRLFDEGFVALVACDPQRSGRPSETGHLKPEQAYRTGQLAHMKHGVFARVFNRPIAADQVCVFVDPGIIERLQAMVTPVSD